MIDIGYDDGGKDRILFVSAQLGSTNSAKRLSRHWRGELDERHIDFFHSKDFHKKGSGVFKGLSKPRRLRLLNKLSTLVLRHLIAGVTIRLDIDLFESLTAHGFRSRWGTTFPFAVQMAMVGTRIYLEQIGRSHEDVNILIAKGHKNVEQARHHAESLINHMGSKILNVKTVGLGEMRDQPLLQAADMLAYGEYQHSKNHPHEIYDALHHTHKGHYATCYLDCTEEIIKPVLESTDAYEAARKAFGMRKPKAQTASGSNP